MKVEPGIIPPEHKRGPKVKIEVTEELLQEVEDYAARGTTIKKIYCHFDVSQQTWLDLCKKHPEILDRFDKGRTKIDAFVGTKLIQKIKSGCTKSIIYYATSRKLFQENSEDLFANEDEKKDLEKNIDLSKIDPVEASKIYQKMMQDDKI